MLSFLLHLLTTRQQTIWKAFSALFLSFKINIHYSSVLYCIVVEISKNYRPTNSGYNLRLSWCSVHGSHCSNIELGGLIWVHPTVPIMCEVRGLRSASGHRTSGWTHSHGMNKNFASAQSQIRDGIFKLLRSPGIDSASLCSLAWRAGTTTLFGP